MSGSLVLVVLIIAVWAAAHSLNQRGVDTTQGILLITVICWFQNMMLPWLFTEGMIAVDTALALLLVKELILIVLCYFALQLSRTIKRPVPRPIQWLIIYFVLVVARSGLGILVLNEPFGSVVRLTRGMLFPVEVFGVAFVTAATVPTFWPRYERITIEGLSVLAAAAIGLYLLTTDQFWVDHVNIAQYNVTVKGDSEATVIFDRGISGTSVGRAFFEWLASLRLIGTFGDPLTAGFVLVLPLSLLLAEQRRKLRRLAALVVLAIAVFLTFSRSVWIFGAVTLAYVFYTRKQLAYIVAFGFACISAWILVPGVKEFMSDSISGLTNMNPDATDAHGRGILAFYSSNTVSLSNVLGSVFRDPTDSEESGYYYMLTQYGVFPLLAFVGVLLSCERFLRASNIQTPMVLVAAGGSLATLVVLNFSYYPISFTAYWGEWILIGAAVGTASAAET